LEAAFKAVGEFGDVRDDIGVDFVVLVTIVSREFELDLVSQEELEEKVLS
jgi:hypothetical protein